ncbi:hypothetical protein ILUMI_01113, partial [Ignelater luminosus]
GDSGGPLQTVSNEGSNSTYNIVGITSVGKICGSTIIPGVYTKVAKYIDWIEEHVWP